MRRLRLNKKADGGIADFFHAEVGDVGDRDAVLACGLQVHHVHADAVAGDDLAPGHGLDDLPVDRRPLHDDGVGVGDDGDQFFRDPGLHPDQVDVEARAVEDAGFEAVIGVAEIGDNDFEG